MEYGVWENVEQNVTCITVLIHVGQFIFECQMMQLQIQIFNSLELHLTILCDEWRVVMLQFQVSLYTKGIQCACTATCGLLCSGAETSLASCRKMCRP